MPGPSSEYSVEHKVPPFRIRQMTNRDPWFYDTLGPFLSRREIVAELGGPVWDDDDKVWYVAQPEEGQVLGMVAIRRDEVCSFYVPPGSRGQLVGYALLHYLMSRSTQALRATATEGGREMFARFGFEESGVKGRYVTMTRGARAETLFG